MSGGETRGALIRDVQPHPLRVTIDHRLHSDVGRRSGMTSTSIPGYDPPLLGVRVTDLVAGPMQAVSRHFLDLGAQVTRVRRPGVTAGAGFGPVVGGIALGSAIAARGAREITADLSTPAGRQAWDDLLAASDILIGHTAPGS